MKKKNNPLKVFLGIIAVLAVIALFFIVLNLLMPVIVHKGKEVVVPNLVGMPRENAEKTLHKLGLKPGAVRSVVNPEIPPERVVAHYPTAGRRVKIGREIDLDISAGAGRVRIPDLTGLPLSNAIVALEKFGFVIARIESIRTPLVPAGRIVAISPPPGTNVRQGTEVIISVSTKTGTFPMPNLVGLNIETARGIIAAQGLHLGQLKPAKSTEPLGTVIFQYPEEGMTVAPGDTVNLIVATADSTPR